MILYLAVLLPLPLCLLVYHFVLWSMEQTALASLSLANLNSAGIIGLSVQGVVLVILMAVLWRFSPDERFKPVYAGLAAAALLTFPAILLRLLGPNEDQTGSLAQTLLCLTGAGVTLLARGKQNKVDWGRGAIPYGILIAGIGFLPFAVLGSFGSLGDTLLSLFAAIAFGLLAATLIASSTENILLDGVGIMALLAMLGSVIGYDGSQLLLLAVLPSFGFAVSALLPSKASASAAIALLAFAIFSMFDPTELTIMLGDIGLAAVQTSAAAITLGLLTGLAALGLRQISTSNDTRQAIGWAGAGLAWLVVIAVFFLFGHPGSHGDRLFVILKDQADLTDAATIQDRDERLHVVYEILTEHADETQAELRQVFRSAGIRYTPYYLENAIEIQGGTLARLYLMTRPEVDRIVPSPRLRAVKQDDPIPGGLLSVDGAPQWNISMIGADRVWEEFNVRGEGIVIGQSDSGVDGEHPALHDQYRGLNSGGDYNWLDPWDGTSAPNDEGGHGTHTLGTILGADGIGVAPKSQWIGCVNLDRNLGNPALYLDCMQFMLAPYPLGGNPFRDGDPSRAAHVLNNSWGCPDIEGCDAGTLLFAANNLRDAGIFVVISTGNDGPMCETVQSPLSLFDSVFSVGAIDQDGNMAEFSSRGPVTVDGSERVKPDIVAPGVNITSALPGGTYGTNSGTSMAGPHVAGAVALIWSAQPALVGDIDATEELIRSTARPYNGFIPDPCGTGGQSSNVFGYGMIDVYEAVRQALMKP